MEFTGKNFEEIDEYLDRKFSIGSDGKEIKINTFPQRTGDDLVFKKGDDIPPARKVQKMLRDRESINKE